MHTAPNLNLGCGLSLNVNFQALPGNRYPEALPRWHRKKRRGKNRKIGKRKSRDNYSFFLLASSLCLHLLLQEISQIKPRQISSIANNQENSQTQQQHQTSLHDIFLNAVRQRLAPQSFYQEKS